MKDCTAYHYVVKNFPGDKDLNYDLYLIIYWVSASKGEYTLADWQQDKNC